MDGISRVPFNIGGHVVQLVVYRLVVFTPQRSKLTVTDLLAVDGQFVMTESADVSGSMENLFLFCLESFAQDDTLGRQGVHLCPCFLKHILLEIGVAPPTRGNLGICLADGTDPLCVDRCRCHIDTLWRTPCGRVARTVPYTYPPLITELILGEGG